MKTILLANRKDPTKFIRLYRKDDKHEVAEKVEGHTIKAVLGNLKSCSKSILLTTFTIFHLLYSG